jgi:uncharacterized membrane protein
MDFSGNGLLVLFHVLFASLWFGGAVYQVRIIGGTLMAAGPQASGFLVALAKRRGIGWYFALTGALTLLFGALLYGQEKVHESAFSGRGLWLTLGALVAVLAYLHGAAINLPLERRWMRFTNDLKGPPTKEQAQQLQDFGMRLGKNGAASAAMVGVAMLLMLMSRVLP